MNHPLRPALPAPSLAALPYENRFAELGAAYGVRVEPQPLREPSLLHVNVALAEELGLDPAALAHPDFVAALNGDTRIDAGCYLATVYAGHQFGVFVPQLGDGRAILLGQVRTPAGGLRELQLKGAGQTPFSRFADGRAVLRSSIREYLASEAMQALGIPTTRALALIGSTTPVRRERVETGAIVCRVAPSHLRFGHFEYFYMQGRNEQLAPLADRVIADHFPHLQEIANVPARYAAWLGEVVERTARLIAHWQSVGFCHGVMNTDNMSVLGLTIDYGPYGFIDAFDAHHICNHSDEGGRYAYDRQPAVGHWNCSRLLQATLPLLDDDAERAVEIATAALDRYAGAYSTHVVQLWRAKLGLAGEAPAGAAGEADAGLIDRFLGLLDRGHSDFTRSFRALCDVRIDPSQGPALRDEIVDRERFDAWLVDYRARLAQDGLADAERRARMRAANPCYVLRNHLLQAAIERAEAGDASEVERLFRLVRQPFEEQPGAEAYAAEPPPEARQIEVSCSS